MNCAHFHGDLSREDVELLKTLLERYDTQVMLKSWVQLGCIGKPSGHGIDKDKARVVEILKRRAFCKRERIQVNPVDVPCYAWQPKEEPRI